MDAPVTLVTGSRKGLGRYLAEHYLRAGHQVIGCSRSEPDWTLPGYRHQLADVSDEAALRDLFGLVRREYGRLDHLVNNAGIAAMNHALLMPAETVERLLATNVTGTFVACREAAKLMRKRGWGRIVNLSSVAAPLHLEGEAVYAATKSAVVTLTQILARELAEFGITVNAVGPTPIDTDLVRGVPAEKLDALRERQAIRRWGTPADVAHVVDFFLRPESEFITAQTIYLGGVC